MEFCDGVRSYIGKKKANESAAIDRTPSRVEEESKEDEEKPEEEEERMKRGRKKGGRKDDERRKGGRRGVRGNRR